MTNDLVVLREVVLFSTKVLLVPCEDDSALLSFLLLPSSLLLLLLLLLFVVRMETALFLALKNSKRPSFSQPSLHRGVGGGGARRVEEWLGWILALIDINEKIYW